MGKDEWGSSRRWGTTMLFIALGAAALCNAQSTTFSRSQATDLTKQAQVCGDEHESSDERIRACSKIIKDGGVRGPNLANMYIFRARAERSVHNDEDAARDLDLAIKVDE